MNIRKLIVSGGIVNSFEWYDYALFGHFAHIIGNQFFPEADTDAALLYAFLAFAVGYIMRPIGGIFFGILGDRLGRKVALSTSIICMSLPTALVGILPTYKSIGIAATVLMITLRILQGLSMGGTLTGSIAFMVEHTKDRRGLIGSISMVGICLGILLGSLISYIVKTSLSAEQFNAWGWRLPFLLGTLIIFVGFYIKNSTEETPLFEKMKDEGRIVNSPIKQVLSNYWLEILISISINSTGSVIFYLQAIFLKSFLIVNRRFLESDVNNLINICYLVMAIVTILAGHLSDLVGRRKILVINLIVIILVTPTLWQVFESGNFISVVIAQITLSILAAAYIGPEPALQAEFYPTQIRNTALSFAYNTATSLFGGTTPYVAAFIIQRTGNFIACVYYIIICAIMSLVALYFYKDRLNAEFSILEN